jgi:chromosomal replication initiation ATPase DnaA
MIAEIPLHRITAEVCKRHGVTLDEIREPNKAKPLVRIRQELMYLLREAKLYSWAKIGAHLCRDHKTVCNGYYAHKARFAL